MPEKLQYQMKLNKWKKEKKAKAEEAKKAAEQLVEVVPPVEPEPFSDLPVIEETKEEADAGYHDNSRFQDSFRSDASFIDESRVETVAPLDESTKRMTVIAEADEDAESRTTQSRKSKNLEAGESVQEKPPVIKPAQTMVEKPKQVITTAQPKQGQGLKRQTTAASSIKTSNRRVSNIDALKV